MSLFTRENTSIAIRPVQYRDFDEIERLATVEVESENSSSATDTNNRQLQRLRQWYGPLKFLSWFPNPYQHAFRVNVAEQENKIRGIIQVAPFNRTRSTWRVERVIVDADAPVVGNNSAIAEIGSQLLRHCFETIWEARTWLLEVNINDKATLALYRQNGFQPLAQLTYWAIAPELLQELAQHEPALPNLLPVNNADAQLLYQLDTVAMPPLIRQVFDRHTHDFKTNFLSGVFGNVKNWINHTTIASGYVFETQRKAAIGHFQLQLCSNGSQPHVAELTVHPAYTWLYPELLSQMAKIAQDLPPQSLHIASSDYQPEREEYLAQLGAERIEHTLLMSRSVWHKLRESKPINLEGLQLSDVLQGLQPARKPVPSRLTWPRVLSKKSHSSAKTDVDQSISTSINSLSEDAAPPVDLPNTPNNGHQC